MPPETLSILLLDDEAPRATELARTLDSFADPKIRCARAAPGTFLEVSEDADYDAIVLSLSEGDDEQAATRELHDRLPDVPILTVKEGLEPAEACASIESGMDDHMLFRCTRCVDGKMLRSRLLWTVERARLEQRLENLQAERFERALHDPLTGIPNRQLFLDRLQQFVARARRSRTGFALLFIDLDRFKAVNDELGHDVGDVVLKRASERMTRVLRESDTAARWGGDEFTVLLDGTCDRRGAARVTEKLLQAIAEPVVVGDHEISCPASVGIAFYPEDGASAKELLRCADCAMYRSKAAGGDDFRFVEREDRTFPA
jgi:diguanylate cyclase (GGDEF)-like protein